MLERRCTMPGCGKAHRARGLCSTHYNQANVKPIEVTCAACGDPVARTTQQNRERYRPTCSTACRAFLQNGPASCVVPDSHPSRSTRIPLTHPCRLLVAIPNGQCRVFLPDCQVCDRVFATRYMATATCSSTCADVKRRHDKQEHKLRERARKRAAFVAPVSRRAIYERDSYRCHLCKRKVLTTKSVPHPRAAVLDHVVPLARGGTHEPANVRTACFMCNCIKGARGGGEQLMLIG